jgi:hypothetical protein
MNQLKTRKSHTVSGGLLSVEGAEVMSGYRIQRNVCRFSPGL